MGFEVSLPHRAGSRGRYGDFQTITARFSSYTML
jgi:hypothetical protein